MDLSTQVGYGNVIFKNGCSGTGRIEKKQSKKSRVEKGEGHIEKK